MMAVPGRCELPLAGRPGQHLLDFDCNAVAVDHHHAAGDRQVVGEDPDLVLLGGVQFDDGASAQPHHLVDGHGGGSENHHEIDGDFIKGWHWGPALIDAKLHVSNTITL